LDPSNLFIAFYQDMQINEYSDHELLELFSSGGSAAEKAFGILLGRYS